MARKSRRARKRLSPRPERKQFLALARELRHRLHEMDQKLDHLIRSYRYFIHDSSSSHQSELQD